MSNDHAAAALKHRLLVQSNGWIVLETRGDGFVHSLGAPDLVYHLEWKAADGSWQRLTGELRDDATARMALREANPRIIWRLVAACGELTVVIPKNWKGACR